MATREELRARTHQLAGQVAGVAIALGVLGVLLGIAIAASGDDDSEGATATFGIAVAVGAVFQAMTITMIARYVQYRTALEEAEEVSEQDRLRTLLPPTDRAPAWLPDPLGAADLRYWNGSAWTEHTHNRDQPPAGPLQPPSP